MVARLLRGELEKKLRTYLEKSSLYNQFLPILYPQDGKELGIEVGY
jgi:hypothetical protein